MRYISFDLETTGLVRDPNNILQIAAVVEDTTQPHTPVEDLPTFVCFVKHPVYTGSAYALQMNSWILQVLAGVSETPYPIHSLEEAMNNLTGFIKAQFGEEKPYVAGVNVGTFDLQFLPLTVKELFHRRHIEAGSVLIDWEKGPKVFSSECTHDALEDVRLVIEKLRVQYS